tara:strand:- start:2796 stop:3110 length:315 start_codon:yes stop_codon:yes gene_type:complete
MPWIDEAEWETEDVATLRQFLVSKSGRKFRRILLNMVLRQNAAVVSQRDTSQLKFEAGYANGMRTTVHTLEALARDIEPEEDLPSDVFGVGRTMSEDPTARRVF